MVKVVSSLRPGESFRARPSREIHAGRKHVRQRKTFRQLAPREVFFSFLSTRAPFVFRERARQRRAGKGGREGEGELKDLTPEKKLSVGEAIV